MARTPKPTPTSPRTETAIIRAYLSALKASSAPRGRRTAEYLQQKVIDLPAQIEATDDPLERVLLTQTLMDCERDLEALRAADDHTAAEQRFIAVAAGWAERKGVSYAALRKVGVPAAVLKQAGVPR